MCCLSNIAGAATTDAPRLEAEGPGAQLALACTYEINHGVTAGEENVRTSLYLIVFSHSNGSHSASNAILQSDF